MIPACSVAISMSTTTGDESVKESVGRLFLLWSSFPVYLKVGKGTYRKEPFTGPVIKQISCVVTTSQKINGNVGVKNA